MAEQNIAGANSTQQFVEIDKIKDGIITLKNGGLRSVVMVAGLNFELKSEEEQDVIISSYQDFLNSLDFSVQVMIHSRKLNIENYLQKMEEIKVKEPNELLKNQIDEYITFIRDFVKQNEIMTKNFFVVIPYEGAGLKEAKKGIMSMLSFGKKKDNKKEQQESFDQQMSQLRQRIDQVLAGLERIGLRSVVLNDDELVELYYNLYNPETIEKDLKKEKVEEQHK